MEAKKNKEHDEERSPAFTVRIDGKSYGFKVPAPTGRDLLARIERDPEDYFLVFLVQGAPDLIVELDDPFDLSAPGTEEMILVSRKRHLVVYVDEERFVLTEALTNGKALLALVKKCPCQFALSQSLPDEPDQFIDADETVDVSKPGVERFVTIVKDDVTVFVEVDDEERPVVVRRGAVVVSTILTRAHLGDTHTLFQERPDGLQALNPSDTIAIEGCEVFQAQVKGGASS